MGIKDDKGLARAQLHQLAGEIADRADALRKATSDVASINVEEASEAATEVLAKTTEALHELEVLRDS